MLKEIDKNVNMYLSKNRIDLKIRFNQGILKEVVNQFGKEILVSKRYDGKIEAIIKNVALSDGLIDDVTDECPSIIATRFKRNYQKEIKFNVKNV